MSEEERPIDMPDTSETYERAHPGKTPGGTLHAPERVPDERPDSVQGSIRNDDDPPALAGQDPQNNADVVDPNDPQAHGGRPDAARQPDAHDAGSAIRNPRKGPS